MLKGIILGSQPSSILSCNGHYQETIPQAQQEPVARILTKRVETFDSCALTVTHMRCIFSKKTVSTKKHRTNTNSGCVHHHWFVLSQKTPFEMQLCSEYPGQMSHAAWELQMQDQHQGPVNVPAENNPWSKELEWIRAYFPAKNPVAKQVTVNSLSMVSTANLQLIKEN